jgi:hypothetical protein
MNTQTPSGDVSVTASGCAACGQPLPARPVPALLLASLPAGCLPPAPPKRCG